jgi:hypothetical protein
MSVLEDALLGFAETFGIEPVAKRRRRPVSAKEREA